jgi:peptidoglycan hydrolase CwlO-like protein
MKLNIKNILIAIVLLLTLFVGGYFLFKKKIQPTMEKHLVEQIDKLKKDNKDSIKEIDSLKLEIAVLQNQRGKITVVHDTKKIKELQAELNKLRQSTKDITIDTIYVEELEVFFKKIIK